MILSFVAQASIDQNHTILYPMSTFVDTGHAMATVNHPDAFSIITVVYVRCPHRFHFVGIPHPDTVAFDRRSRQTWEKNLSFLRILLSDIQINA